MVIEYSIVLDGRSHPVVISDEPEALLAAKAAGRAIIGVEGNGNKWNITCAHYIIPDFMSASRELAELVLRRHLGLPWTIGTTGRLLIREFVKEDAGRIPEEEYGVEEKYSGPRSCWPITLKSSMVSMNMGHGHWRRRGAARWWGWLAYPIRGCPRTWKACSAGLRLRCPVL